MSLTFSRQLKSLPGAQQRDFICKADQEITLILCKRRTGARRSDGNETFDNRDLDD